VDDTTAGVERHVGLTVAVAVAIAIAVSIPVSIPVSVTVAISISVSVAIAVSVSVSRALFGFGSVCGITAAARVLAGRVPTDGNPQDRDRQHGSSGVRHRVDGNAPERCHVARNWPLQEAVARRIACVGGWSMRRNLASSCLGAGLCLMLGLPAVAAAQEPESPDAIAAEPLEPSIYGGSPSATCGWPTTVLVGGNGGLCTGTLVHPQLVITAAHCTGNNEGKQIGFGPTGNSMSRSATCHPHPNYGGSATNDIAYCTLSQAVDNVPIVPVLFGCEVAEYIQAGQQVDIVGYGQTNFGGAGTKYEVTTTITGYQNGEVFIGGNGLDSCSGDSGGPVYVQIDDGSWRVFGITSYGGQCGSGGVYGNMATNLAWVEQQSGLDVTPCFDSQGNWTPNPTCGSFPIDPGSGNGTSWQQGCGGGPVSGFAATCGSPFSAEEDDEPPSVTITAPTDGATYMTGGAGTVAVTVDATASDNVGLQKLSLVVNGDPVPNSDDFSAPFSWNLEFPPGSWTIEAVALDYSDNQDTSNAVTIGVDQAPEPPPPDPDTGEDSGAEAGSAARKATTLASAKVGCRPASGSTRSMAAVRARARRRAAVASGGSHSSASRACCDVVTTSPAPADHREVAGTKNSCPTPAA
jgi:V8-like Glu-specific endopeptidase